MFCFIEFMGVGFFTHQIALILHNYFYVNRQVREYTLFLFFFMNINKCPNYHYQAFSDYVIYVNRIIALKIYSLLLLNYVIMQCLNKLCHHAIVLLRFLQVFFSYFYFL